MGRSREIPLAPIECRQTGSEERGGFKSAREETRANAPARAVARPRGDGGKARTAGFFLDAPMALEELRAEVKAPRVPLAVRAIASEGA